MASAHCIGPPLPPPPPLGARGHGLRAAKYAAARSNNLGPGSSEESPKHGDAFRRHGREAGQSGGLSGGSPGAATKLGDLLGTEKPCSRPPRRCSHGRTAGKWSGDRDLLGVPSDSDRKVGREPGVVCTASLAGGPNHDSNPPKRRAELSVRVLALAACFGGTGGLVKALLSALPPDFADRWRSLFDAIPQSEVRIPRGSGTPTVLFDRHGVVVATITAGGCGYEGYAAGPEGAGEPSTFALEEIPCWMWQAVVASEDRRFFKHCGVDYRGLSRAVLSMGTSGGGSTITQQLVRNVCLSNERKWTRKVLEILLAVALERKMSKWDILYRYLKKIYWGHGVYGIDGASALYFRKHPSLLTLEECTMLAGIIPAPEFLSPYHDPSRGKKPQARTLRRMVEAGFLDTATAVRAASHPLRLASESSEGTAGSWKAPYFVGEVLHELTQKYGWTKVANGGLQVHTTLDLSMQTIAEEVIQDSGAEYDDERILLSENGLQRTLEEYETLQAARQRELATAVEVILRRGKLHDKTASLAAKEAVASVGKRFAAEEQDFQSTILAFEKEITDAKQPRLEAAMVAVDPMSGAVRVLVGGRDYYKSNFNRCTQAFRSPGSTFKPVVYLTALAEGFKRNHILMDEPFTIGDFTPENYDQKFRGRVTLEQSLVYSLNVPTARLCAEVGIDKVRDMGRALGIKSYLPHDLTLASGRFEVTSMQLATVYATIAAGGVYHEPYFVSRVETCDGRIVAEHKPSKAEQSTAINEGAIAELRTLLQAAVDKGAGRGAHFGRPCAGQAGTSDDHRDVWFAGFAPEISCVVWLGYDDKAPVGGLHSAIGASHATQVWKTFMNRTHEGLPVRKFHGMDKYGRRGDRRFEKRSRRHARHGFQNMKLRNQKKTEKKVPWRQFWDWKNASVAWEEQEKMAKWAASFATRAPGTRLWPWTK